MAIPDTTPLNEQNGALELLQSGFFQEAEDATFGGSTVSDVDYSDGEGVSVGDTTDDISFSFTLDYTIPAAEVGMAVRLDTLDGTHPPFDLRVGGETVDGALADGLTSGLKWFSKGNSGRSSDLTPGTVTAELDATSVGSGLMEVDCLFVFDARQSYTFDNTVDQDNGHLDGPELFPDQVEYDLATESLDQPATGATVTQTWNDTSGNQYVEVDLGGETTRNSSSTNATVSVSRPNAKEQANARVSLCRFGTRDGASPPTGHKGQQIDGHDLSVDPIAIVKRGIGRARTYVITPDGDLSGSSDDLSEAGSLDANDNLLTRGVFSTFEIPSTMAISSNELVEFERD